MACASLATCLAILSNDVVYKRPGNGTNVADALSVQVEFEKTWTFTGAFIPSLPV